MSKSTAVITCLLLLLLSSIAWAEPTSRKKIEADAVQVTNGAMTGTFRVTESSDGVPSPGTGGACLVFSKRRRGGAKCSLDADCAAGTDFPGGYGYCLHDAGRSGEEKRGRCWVRPAETPEASYCRRSRTLPLPINQGIGFPVDGAGAMQPVANPRRGWWRVHACLNQIPGACGITDSTLRMTNNGPPKRLP